MFKKAKQLFKKNHKKPAPHEPTATPTPSSMDAALPVPQDAPPPSPTEHAHEGAEAQAPQPKKGFFGNLRSGLKKTRNSLSEKLRQIMPGRRILDETLLEELEEVLISADLGVSTTMKLTDGLRKEIKKGKHTEIEDIRSLLKARILEMIHESPRKPWQLSAKPMVALVIGVNGVGKTTTIGKLAQHWKSQNRRVLICAADTFRAAATEQLEIWAQRAQVPIVIRGSQNRDPASVVFEAVKRAQEESFDVLIVDTAGRLHNNPGLMNELAKMRRVIQKQIPDAPHHVALILDAVTGQNGLQQAQQFVSHVGATDLIITKLDGTAKGGVAVAIAHEMQLPIQFLGVGEKIDDLVPFDPEAFVEAMLA